MPKTFSYITICLVFLFSCKDKKDDPPAGTFQLSEIIIDGTSAGANAYTDVSTAEPIKLDFSEPVDISTVEANIGLIDNSNAKVAVNYTYGNDNQVVSVTPQTALEMFSPYTLNIWPGLKSENGAAIATGKSFSITTGIDSTGKFPRITDDELLTLVQKQTFKYFWDFGHPVSGMARERSTSGNTVTTGGTGFGVMAMIVAAERGFITRTEALGRVQKIVSFLETKCTSYHGAFAHWIDGETGQTIPFSDRDNGADLVETSFLMQGLLTARQYFDGAGGEEQLRNGITGLWQNLDWNWFRKDSEENVLYWHWSPDYGWAMNMPVSGWNECLIVYVLAASSPAHGITKDVYDKGWARNGAMKNGAAYYGYTLPLGDAYGGPLFFAHYSFLGLNPKGLSDQYADYWVQNQNHALINYSYCVDNPLKYSGYSADCWGLTASDGDKGYSAHSPTNDKGVIAPTAALASIPYTPEQSMRALRFYYYTMGNILWKDNGFVDAFNFSAHWFDTQYVAIDQGPVIVMIENYRTGLLWNLFMTCPEIQAGLDKLGFQYINR